MLLGVLLAFPVLVYAQAPIDVGAILGRIEGILWTVFGGLTIIMIVVAGIFYLTAKGDPGKVDRANKALIWAAVGVTVGILAYSAEAIISYFIYG